MTHFVPVNDTDALGGLDRALERLNLAREALDSATRAAAANPEQKRAQKDLDKARAELDKAVGLMRAALAESPKASGADLSSAKALLPEGRGRQARSFPSCTPEDPVLFLSWDAEPGEHRQALADLCARVVRIGHSSTLVACALVDEAPPARWFPDPDGEAIFRVVGPGQLDALEAEHQRHLQTEPRVLPSRFQPYRQGEAKGKDALASSIFGEDWVLLSCRKGSRLPTVRGVELARGVRRALLHFAGDEAPELITGHRGESASPDPHLAVVPLPRVGDAYADGLLYGVALILPRGVEDRAPLYRALARWREECPEQLPIYLDNFTVWTDLLLDDPTLETLRPRAWCRPSRDWVSVTPIALDRNPGQLAPRAEGASAASERAQARAAESLRRSCQDIGLPEPEVVQWIPGPAMSGAPPARRFPVYCAHPGQPQRAKAHFHLRFSQPVRGPILLGAGRFFGLGLMRPVEGSDGAAR